MARTTHPAAAPDTAPVAADGVPDAAPATDTPAGATGPAAAVLTALTALKGAAVTDIARHAGQSVADTRKILIGFEKDGAATREKGGKPGKADTWRAAPAPEARDDEQAGRTDEPGDPGEQPAGTQADHAPASETFADDAPAGPDEPAGTGDAAEADGPGTPGPGDDSGTDDDRAETDRADEQPAEPGADGSQDGPAPDNGEETADGDAADGAGDPPDPALVAEASASVLVIAQAIADIGTALVAGRVEDALDAIEAIREPAAQARRVLKAASRKRGTAGSSRRTPSVRPGGLRDLVEQHLYRFPGQEFTAHEIGKVLNRSSGAVANALERLSQPDMNVAELSNEKPRRFRLRPDAPARPDLTDDAAQPGTEADPGAEAAPEPEADTGAGTEPGDGTAPAAESAPEQEPGDDAGAGTEPDAEPEADAEADAGITAGAA